ncbi:MAG: cell division protein FtsA [Bacteroidetes bacterium]|nr:cell division protein FtsA [Bacteroidota bacterium]
MAKNVTVGIDIGTAMTKIMVVEHAKTRDKNMSRVIGTGSAPTKGLVKGFVQNQKELIRTIEQATREAEMSSGIKIRQATISIGGITLESKVSRGSSIISRADNEVTSFDIQKAIKDSEQNLKVLNKHIIETIPVIYKLDTKEIYGKVEGLRGVKLEVTTLFINCSNQHLEDIVGAINAAGIDVVDVIASPIAASIASLDDRQKTAGCILIDIGNETTSVVVFEDGNIISLKVLPIGSNNITNDLALGLQISLEEAEGVKIGKISADVSQTRVDSIINTRLNEIFTIVQEFLKRMKRDERLPAGAIIIGGGANVKSIESVAKRILKLPSQMTGLKSKKTLDPTWFIAYGLCVSGKDDIQKNNNYPNPLSHIFHNLKKFFAGIGKQLMP